MGTSGDLLTARVSDGGNKNPVEQSFLERMMGLEPTTFCMASAPGSFLLVPADSDFA